MLHSYTPPHPLYDFIEVLWCVEGGASTHQRERVLPDGSVELVINLHEEHLQVYKDVGTPKALDFRGSVLCGPQSESMVIDTTQQTLLMGVHFRPGGAFPFFQQPASEFHNQHIELGDLWGAFSSELRERLIAGRDVEDRFRILSGCLARRLQMNRSHHAAVSFALQALQAKRNIPKISDLTERMGYSSRYFIKVFRQQVGMTPKKFARLQRFQQFVQILYRRQDVVMVDAALDVGFFDQSHLNHEFKAFSGLTPTEYASHCSGHYNHVVLKD